MKKVTGIGGVFLQCDDPKAINSWYATHLGLETGPYGTTFQWRHDEAPDRQGSTTWCAFPKDAANFQGSQKGFMVNYRVDDLQTLVRELEAAGVTILDEIAEYPFGNFVHILDPEGNVVELWQPAGE